MNQPNFTRLLTWSKLAFDKLKKTQHEPPRLSHRYREYLSSSVVLSKEKKLLFKYSGIKRKQSYNKARNSCSQSILK
jgi:hypothetical protein